MNNADSDKVLTHLTWAAGGMLLGQLWADNRAAAKSKSRAERDYPDDIQEVYDEIASLLEDWQPSDDCEDEDDFVDDLATFLDEHSEWEIEARPHSEEGCPDILVGDLLALELKLDPGKPERDRLVGQCAGYSRLWATWAILIDSPDSNVGKLVRLLADRGLNRILVWAF